MDRKFESYRLSARAEGDLAQIYDYTVKHWSTDQAGSYIADIRAAVIGLVAGAKTGRGRDGAPEHYRFYPVGSHLIVYRETKMILVVRILHQRMDIERHL